MREHIDEVELERLSFFESYFGLLTGPADVTRKLFAFESPPYVLAFVVVFILSLVLPFVLYGYIFNSWPLPVRSAIVALATLGALSFSITALGLVVCGLIFSSDVTPSRIIASVAYSTAPLSLALLLLAGSDYYTHGGFSVVQTVAFGAQGSSLSFSKAIPIAFLVCYLMMFAVFVSSLQAAFNWSSLGSFLTAVLASAVFVTATNFSLIVTDRIHPSTTTALKFILFKEISLFQNYTGHFWVCSGKGC